MGKPPDGDGGDGSDGGTATGDDGSQRPVDRYAGSDGSRPDGGGSGDQAPTQNGNERDASDPADAGNRSERPELGPDPALAPLGPVLSRETAAANRDLEARGLAFDRDGVRSLLPRDEPARDAARPQSDDRAERPTDRRDPASDPANRAERPELSASNEPGDERGVDPALAPLGPVLAREVNEANRELEAGGQEADREGPARLADRPSTEEQQQRIDRLVRGDLDIRVPAEVRVRGAVERFERGTATERDVKPVLERVVAELRGTIAADRGGGEQQPLAGRSVSGYCDVITNVALVSAASLLRDSAVPVTIERLTGPTLTSGENGGIRHEWVKATFELPGGPRSYLIDVTYAQFWRNADPPATGPGGINRSEYLDANTEQVRRSSGNAEFATGLLERGYAELNPTNARQFAESLVPPVGQPIGQEQRPGLDAEARAALVDAIARELVGARGEASAEPAGRVEVGAGRPEWTEQFSRERLGEHVETITEALQRGREAGRGEVTLVEQLHERVAPTREPSGGEPGRSPSGRGTNEPGPGEGVRSEGKGIPATEATAHGLGGGAFLINAGAFKVTELGQKYSIDKALEEKGAYISQLRSEGQYVVARAIIAVPPPNPFNDAAKFKDAGDVQRFVGVSVTSGTSLREALEGSTLSAASGSSKPLDLPDGWTLKAVELARFVPPGANPGPADRYIGQWGGPDNQDRLAVFPNSSTDPRSVSVAFQLDGMAQPVTSSSATVDSNGRITATFEDAGRRLDVSLKPNPDGSIEATLRAPRTPDTIRTFVPD